MTDGSAAPPRGDVDVVIPYWGEPEYLRQAVQSVLAQTVPHWRLTVLDDAYPSDWAGAYLEGLDDPRIRYVRNAENQGITAAFQRSVELATADIVVVCGCDDLLRPTYVETVLRAYAEHPDVDIVQPGVDVIDGDGQVVRTLADTVKQRLIRPRVAGPTVLGGEALAVSLLHGDWLYWPSLAFRRSRLAATPFRAGFPIVLDLAVVMDLLCDGATMLLEPTVCFAYRRHHASASSVELLDGDRFAGERDYFRLAAGLVAQKGWRRAARAARLHVSSRLHALTLLPTAVLRRPRAVPMLLRHALAP